MPEGSAERARPTASPVSLDPHPSLPVTEPATSQPTHGLGFDGQECSLAGNWRLLSCPLPQLELRGPASTSVWGKACVMLSVGATGHPSRVSSAPGPPPATGQPQPSQWAYLPQPPAHLSRSPLRPLSVSLPLSLPSGLCLYLWSLSHSPIPPPLPSPSLLPSCPSPLALLQHPAAPPTEPQG